jgi:hypothetical protein
MPWNFGNGAVLGYVCGWCGRHVAVPSSATRKASMLFICNSCDQPTFAIYGGEDGLWTMQMPKPLPGATLSGLPDDVEPLWTEIRRAAAEDSPTLAVMGCRKMLMHLGVEAAKEDGVDDPSYKNFWSAVEYLRENNWLPKRAPDIGHIILKTGNEVNHEVVMSDDAEAEVVVLFTEAVLRNMYDLPAQVGELNQPPAE